MNCAADVVVVGGGPAGAAAAIWAALAGLRVTLLERSAFPRHRPGETLHPGVQSIFRQLGVEKHIEAASTVRHGAQRIVWGGRDFLTGFGADEQGPWLGYQILREKLDSILIERAREVGVYVAQPDTVEAVIVETNRVVGVRTSKTIRGRFFIDAGGGRGWLRRQLGLKVKTASPSLYAYYGYCEGELEEPCVLPSLTADEEGWTWIAEIGPRQFHWTRLAFAHEGRTPHPPPVLASLRQTSRIRGADVTWRLVQPAAGSGYFIAGDAAVVLDPAASHGVLRALMSGMMAAHAVRQIMAGTIDENSAALQYCVWLNEWFQHDLAHLVGLYQQLNPPPIWLGAGGT
jgi:flavin-dependent dehydrogenase